MASAERSAELVETWTIHNRINLYLLAAVTPAGLAAKAAGRGRAVALQFAHMHNVRLIWLKSAAAERLAGQRKFEADDEAPSADVLGRALTDSGNAIAELLRSSLAEGGRIKGFKPHATAFAGYLIAHEAHHRGQIALTLKLAGEPLDKSIAFGLWEWGSR
jgi:uncharacterized damage-inducible protein DinB